NDRRLIQLLHARLQSLQAKLEGKFVRIARTAAVSLNVFSFSDSDSDQIERRGKNDRIQCIEKRLALLRIQKHGEVTSPIAHLGCMKNHGIVAESRDLQSRHRWDDLIYVPV